MHKLLLEKFLIIYKPNKRAKSIKVRSGACNSLEISYPASLSKKAINDFLHNKAQTISELYRDSSSSLYDYIKARDFNIILGNHTISFKRATTTKITKNFDNYIINYSSKDALLEASNLLMINQIILKYAKKVAKQQLPVRVEQLATKFKYRYNRIFFRNQKSRWGSCSSDNNLSLNIRLMLLPNELIEYVLLHELVHTVHKNHSDHFWRELEQNMPQAKQLRKNLRAYNFSFLNLDN